MIASSRGVVGDIVAWPPSPAITDGVSELGIRQATPSPVPGPRTAIGAPDTAGPPPRGYRCESTRWGNDRAVASKSLTSRTCSKPNAAHSSYGSIVHGQLVSTQRLLSIGPAAASSALDSDRFCRR